MPSLEDLNKPDAMRDFKTRVAKLYNEMTTYDLDISSMDSVDAQNETDNERLARIAETGLIESNEDLKAVINNAKPLSDAEVESLLLSAKD